ncbi:MAG TPA: DMT family transporter [Patescibacteria group bacterium]
MKQYYGYLSLLLTAFIFATFGIYIRVLNQDLTTYQQIFFRGFLGFILALVFAAFLKKKPSLTQVSKSVLAGYIFFFPLSAIFFTFSILNTKIATTLFGFYVSSLVATLLLGKLYFKEQIGVVQKIALALAFAGLAIYTYPLSWESLNIGLVFSLVAGTFDSFAQALRKYITGKVDRLILVVIQMFGVALVSLPFVFLTLNQGVPEISLLTWGVGIWYGLMLIAVNYLLLYAFSNFDLNLGTIVLSSELFFAVMLAFLIFGETTTAQELMGAIVIFMATTLAGVDANVFAKMFKWSK